MYLLLPKNVDGDVEGFGLSILEASASGIPVVVGKGSVADDAVLDGQSGFLVDGNNEEEVIEKVSLLLDDNKLSEKLSNGAEKWARRNSWESKIERYKNIYEKI